MTISSGYINICNLDQIAIGLNIEGYRPTLTLPKNCKWYNIVQAIDEPLKGTNFNDVMKIVKDNHYEYIEQAVDININNFICKLVNLINKISTNHKNVLVHVHQYVGTTILNKTLEKETGIKTILDTTNFYENPIDYQKVYPDIDALISISQCAGFGVKAGTWIVPTGFMDFDVVNNVILTKKILTENHITDFIKFDYMEGNILVVNDLWNPNIEQQQEGVLLLDDEGGKVLDFVKENTAIFDESHDWHHAIKVAYNSTKILNNKYVLYLALLHDVCDHKYKNALTREKLNQWINDNLFEYKIIDEMIEKISFSKQKTFESVNPIVEAVRDGDRMEAIGQIGIERCEQFVKSKNGQIPEDVIVHCFEKLLKIVPENYIVTDIGRKNAIKHHNVIVHYVRNNLCKTNLSYFLPDYL